MPRKRPAGLFSRLSSGVLGGLGDLARIGGGGAMQRGAEAEAGGNYTEAARHYAAAGDRARVAQMHLYESERTQSPDQKLEALREAAKWADEDHPDALAVRRRVAGALLAFCRARGVITAGDRAVVAEAAALFTSAGDASGAGSCHELLGASGDAADAYQAAGEVDRLEQILASEADRRRRTVAVSDSLDDHRLRLRSGDIAGALLALDLALPAAEPHERAPIQVLRDDLVARRLDPDVLRLRVDDSLVVAARAPIVLGREARTTLPLRDGGISRRHVSLERDGARWSVRDLGSKNGTLLGGVRIDGSVPLPEHTELGVGTECVLDVKCGDAQLVLTIVRGIDRGAVLHATSDAPLLIAPRRAQGALRVRFVEGRALVGPVAATLRLNGTSVSREVEPLAGDVLECAETRWQVLP